MPWDLLLTALLSQDGVYVRDANNVHLKTDLRLWLSW